MSPLRGLEEEAAGTTASSLRSSTMAINGSALRAFSHLDFHAFYMQIGLSKYDLSLTRVRLISDASASKSKRGAGPRPSSPRSNPTLSIRRRLETAAPWPSAIPTQKCHWSLTPMARR